MLATDRSSLHIGDAQELFWRSRFIHCRLRWLNVSSRDDFGPVLASGHCTQSAEKDATIGRLSAEQPYSPSAPSFAIGIRRRGQVDAR